MVRKQLTALVLLAKTDEKIDDSELNLIFRIGRANRLEDEEIQEIVDNPGNLGSLRDLDEDEKFEFLFSIMKYLMPKSTIVTR